MQRCPRCGVRNLDSDLACFNCDEILTGKPVQPAQPFPPAAYEEVAAPEVERAARRAPERKSFIGLVLGTVLLKVLLLLLAFGLFSIVSLLVMWVAYDSTAGAAVSLSVLGVAAVFAFVYPDISRARLNGRLGGFVALVSDLLILLVFVTPVLIVAERKVSGAAGYVLDYWWAIAGLLVEAFLVGFLFGYRAWRRGREVQATTEKNAVEEQPYQVPQ